MPTQHDDFTNAPGGHALLDHVQPISARRLAHSALASFSTLGYGGTTTRVISQRAGLSAGALYSSFASKEDILFLCALYAHESALETLKAAANGEGSVTLRMRRMIYDFTLWHAQNFVIARVSQYELAALTPEHHEKIASLRRAMETVMRTHIELGVAEREFNVVDVDGLTLAALSLAIDVCRWFSPSGRLNAEQLAESYAGLVLRMVSSFSSVEAVT
jgi:AcrR family transcriptional regulator